MEAMLLAHQAFIFRFGKHWINGDTRDGDLVRWNAKVLHVDSSFIQGNEVMLVVMAEPHCMNVEIRDDDRLRAFQPSFCF